MANTIQVLNGTTLTFQCIAQISTLPATMTALRFSDLLDPALTYVANSAVASYSINGTNYTNDWTLRTNYNVTEPVTNPSTGAATDTPLLVDVLTASIDNAMKAGGVDTLFVKVILKATINDLNKLLNNGSILNNVGEFTIINVNDTDPDNPVTPLSATAPVKLEDTTVEQYSPEVGGYSLNVCKNVGETFDAKFCFDAINGEYVNATGDPNADYVLTIKAVPGFSFPTDLASIKAYIGCSDSGTEIPAGSITSQVQPNGDLKITIDHTTEDKAAAPASGEIPATPATVDMCGEKIGVIIPLTINECALYETSPLCLDGSLDFMVDGVSATSLAHCCLCVNFNCNAGLVARSKILLC